jgi:FG-GAP repeat
MRTAFLTVFVSLAATLPAQTPRFRQVTIATGLNPGSIAVADVNHDHNPDIIVANEGSETVDGSVTVLLGDGHGAFHPSPDSPFPAGHLYFPVP